jgi:hypothetical protein
MGTIENAPDLELDKLLYSDHPMLAHVRRERRIVWNLFKHLEADGWNVVRVYEGEEDPTVTDAKSAMEVIFNYDDVVVSFSKVVGTTHGVKLVLGNDLDIISDWYYKAGDEDGFNALMEKFDAEAFA